MYLVFGFFIFRYLTKEDDSKMTCPSNTVLKIRSQFLSAQIEGWLSAQIERWLLGKKRTVVDKEMG